MKRHRAVNNQHMHDSACGFFFFVCFLMYTHGYHYPKKSTVLGNYMLHDHDIFAGYDFKYNLQLIEMEV